MSGDRRMHVGINLLWLVPGVVGGTEQAMVQTLQALQEERPAGIDYTLYTLESFRAAHPSLVEGFPTRVLSLRGGVRSLRVVAEGTWLSRAVRRDGVDLVHHPGGTVPLGSRLPAILTLHDMQPFDLPGNFHPVKRAYIHRMVPRAVREARKVVVPCRFVQGGVVERFDLPPDRTEIVPWGVAPLDVPEATVEEVRLRYDLPERWFIYPAITYPHKNHLTLVRAFARLAGRHPDIALVLTGGAAGAETALQDEVARLGLAGRVHRTGRIGRDDLDALLAGAVALPFPSRYEGFGLPVLEAMALSTPVIAADAAGLPEAVEDAGVLVDPDDVEGWSEAMTRMLEPGERRRLVEAGRQRALELTWARTAAAHARVHRSVMNDLDLLAGGDRDS